MRTCCLAIILSTSAVFPLTIDGLSYQCQYRETAHIEQSLITCWPTSQMTPSPGMYFFRFMTDDEVDELYRIAP